MGGITIPADEVDGAQGSPAAKRIKQELEDSNIDMGRPSSASSGGTDTNHPILGQETYVPGATRVRSQQQQKQSQSANDSDNEALVVDGDCPSGMSQSDSMSKYYEYSRVYIIYININIHLYICIYIEIPIDIRLYDMSFLNLKNLLPISHNI